MRKGTIFYYELRRLLGSRAYLLLLTALILFSGALLRGMVLFGAHYTAPFSQWTFTTYLSSVSPLLLILLLILCTRQFTPAERGAAAIISAAPMPAPTFKLLRYGAIGCAFLCAAALPVAACFLFYWLVFDFTAIGGLFGSALLLLLPPAIFLFGAAMLWGSGKAAVVYLLLAAVLIIGVFQVPLPAFIDTMGSSAIRPLDAAEQGFAFTSVFVAGRAAFLVAGIAFIILSLSPLKKPTVRSK